MCEGYYRFGAYCYYIPEDTSHQSKNTTVGSGIFLVDKRIETRIDILLFKKAEYFIRSFLPLL
jgi:hypothetical protein